MAKVNEKPRPINRPLKNDPACTRCQLARMSATVCCPSVGPRDSKIMLVGEALGKTEDELGRPFVGDAGYKLNYLLKKAGLKRKQIRIGNAVRCRPPNNVKPSKKIVDACWPYLWYDMLDGKPGVIVTLGATATNAVLGQRKLEDARGFPVKKEFTWEAPSGRVLKHECWVIPTYHPAGCLRDWRYDDLVVRDLIAANEYVAGRPTLKWPDTKVAVATTMQQVRRLIKRLTLTGTFVYDVETTGLSPHTSRILCIGFCYEAGKANIIPLRNGAEPFWKQDEYAEIIRLLTELFEKSGVCGQNVKFDNNHVRALTGIDDFRVAFDTQCAHHCLDENKPHNLTFMCQWYLNWDNYEGTIEPFFSPEHGYRDAPPKLLWTYCGHDVNGTFQLMQMFKKQIAAEKVDKAFSIELGLINPLADIEYRGMRVSKDRIVELSTMYRHEADKCYLGLQKYAARYIEAKTLDKFSGQRFNPNSPQQLRLLLKEARAGLKRTTATGQLSVNKNVLKHVSLSTGPAAKIAKLVQDLRKYTKYVGTYLDGPTGNEGFIQWVSSRGRIHPSYNITNARTSRLSVDDPPVQTIPRQGDLRSIILPCDPEFHVLLSCDYSKAELCVVAWRANDPVMARELLNGIDIHTRMACTKRLMRDPTDAEFEKMAQLISKEERALAKGAVFGIIYGITAYGIVERNPDAFPFNMPKRERVMSVEKLIAAYFKKYKAVKEYQESTVYKVHERGFLRTFRPLGGRKRRLTGIEWFNSEYARRTSRRDEDLGHLEREAMNFEIQTIASDALNTATARTYKAIRKSRIPGLRIILSLHDQLLFNVDRRYVDEAANLVSSAMKVVLPKDAKHKFEMPLLVDVSVQNYWGHNEYTS